MDPADRTPETATASDEQRGNDPASLHSSTRRVALASLAGLAAYGLAGGSVTADPEPDPDDYDDLLDEADGDGSEDDPYVIRSVRQLQAIQAEPDAHYRLGEDVDASETAGWNREDGDARGFDPISQFRGSLDGNGHEIRQLTIDRPAEDEVGLVGSGQSPGHVVNLTMTDHEVTGGDGVGAVAGYQNDFRVENCRVEGGSVDGEFGVGGVVGRSRSGGTVTDSSASGTVIGDGLVGGLVGSASLSFVTDSYATADVDGDTNVGGLAGWVANGIDVEEAYATGEVSGEENVGGLVGTLDTSTVSDSHATGNVQGAESVGGLVGTNFSSRVEDSYAEGDVTGGDNAGGAIGHNFFGSLTVASYATGAVSGEANVGGLVGRDSASGVEQSYATGTVDGDESVGGITGLNDNGDVDESFATGSVDGDEHVGGLVGRMDDAAGVEKSYAIGSVTGVENVGGLVGSNDGEFTTITVSYAAGSVEGEIDVGGLVASNDGTIEDAYWDVPATGQTDSAGGTGLGDPDEEPPADAMIGEGPLETLDGFDFDEPDPTWATVVDPDGYPVLVAHDEDAEEEPVYWQIDFGEGQEPPMPPAYYPDDLMAALGNADDGVTENPSFRRQLTEGQLADVDIVDSSYQFDDDEEPTEVTVEFELEEDAEERALHLASFVLPGPFDMEEIEEQELFESTSGTYEGGDTGSLTISVPDEDDVEKATEIHASGTLSGCGRPGTPFG